jgi:hypothetical protein
LAAGFLGAAAGLLLISGIHTGASYPSLLPGMILLGVSSGMCFPATANAALHQVTGQNAGLASGVQNTMQQAGGALGLASLVTIALRHAGGGTVRGFRPGAAAANPSGGDALVLAPRGRDIASRMADPSPDGRLTAPRHSGVSVVPTARRVTLLATAESSLMYRCIASDRCPGAHREDRNS